MQITATQLNEVASLLGTNDKQVVIAAVMKTLVKSGMSADIAFDFVFGDGAFKRFAGVIYEALRAQ